MEDKKETERKQSEAREEQFKDKPILALYRYPKDRKPIRFGQVKWGLILAHLDEIKAFNAKHQKEASTTA